MRPVAVYWGAKRLYEKVANTYIHWPNDSRGPPPDVPKCGFMNDAKECQPPEGFPVAITVSVVSISLVFIGIIVSLLVYRKLKLESELADYWWKVKYEDIFFPQLTKSGNKSAVSLAMSESSFGAARSQAASTAKAPSVVNSLATAASNINGVNLGIYRGIKVAVKPLNMKRVHVNRELLVEFKLVS